MYRYLEKCLSLSGQLTINSVSTEEPQAFEILILESAENFPPFPPTALGNHWSKSRGQVSKG